jgi:hypothetical protein
VMVSLLVVSCVDKGISSMKCSCQLSALSYQ